MDEENITDVWNFLYHIICWDLSMNRKSLKRAQRHEASKKFLMLFPEEIRKVLVQLGPEQEVESIIKKLFGETVRSSRRLRLSYKIKRSLDKYCPKLKPHAQNLCILIESKVRKPGDTRGLSKRVWNICLEIAKSLPLPPSLKMPPDLGEARNIGMQDAVLQRLKEEMLPNEISKILKLIEEDRLPREVLPILEDFPVISSDEQAFDNEDKWKCEICGRVFQNSAVLQHHMKQEHLKMKSYTCDICSQRFAFQFELQCHRKTHNHICKICKQVFTSKLALMNHSMCHKKNECVQKTELYRCEFCEKVFAFKSHLVTHAKQHTLQQPAELNQPHANNDSSRDSLAFTQFQKKVKKFWGHDCCAYILSSDRTLCYNKRDKRYHRVADIVRPCQVLLSDVNPTEKFCNPK